jgi:hypothetical protein
MQQINEARKELRNSRDVVSLTVADDYDYDDLYKAEIFRVQSTKLLAWYQIQQDERIIRRERIKGTSAEEFVEKYVLPFIKQTEEAFRMKFGDRIYNR